MRIIDGHVHIGKWGEVFLNYETTVNQAVEVMKNSGIDAAVCMPADAEPNLKLLNESYDRKDFKFYFCAWLNPDDAELDKFLEDNLNKIHFFKVHPSLVRKKITDYSFEKYFKIAEQNKIPVIVHAGGWVQMSSFVFPLDVAEKHAELDIIIAHLGGSTPVMNIECANTLKERKLNNVYLGTESIREFDFVRRVAEIAGTDRIIFGSDYNLGLPEMYITVIDSLPFPMAEKEKIFSGNILKLIRKREEKIKTV